MFYANGCCVPYQTSNAPNEVDVKCLKCQSDAVAAVPAEIRLYRNSPRTLSHPPVTPSPDITVCLDCGWSEFTIPQPWLSAGWLRPPKKEPTATVTPISAVRVAS